MVTKNFGYTLVELMVVLAVIGVLSILMFYGVSSFQNGQAVKNAQLKFVSDLSLLQTKVNSGADGHLFKEVELIEEANSYKIDGEDVNLPKDVKILFPDSNYQKLWLCFANPNFLNSYSKGYLSSGPQNICGKNVCARGSVGIYFACRQGGGRPEIDSGTITVRFSNTSGELNKDVTVDGSGMNINNINAL